MNIELTPTEAKALRTLLEADMRKMSFNIEHCNLLSGIKKKTTYISAEELYTEDGYESYSHSHRWGK